MIASIRELDALTALKLQLEEVSLLEATEQVRPTLDHDMLLVHILNIEDH